MKVTIIGAGIGGLTLAIALQQKGVEVEIFEATPEFKKVGAGIALAINAMQVYQRLGLAQELEASGNCLDTMAITDAALNILAKNGMAYFKSHYSLNNVAIHRATLHRILLAQLPKVPLHLNKKLKTLKEHKEGVDLEFWDGTTHRADLVIGADGIHSGVRQAIFPKIQERMAKQVCWRGVVSHDLGDEKRNLMREAWGGDRRFGIVPIEDKQIYWFACISYQNNADEFTNTDIAPLFSKFAPLVQELIKKTPKDKIITAELSDLEILKTWHKGRVCLVGDAAHATTPNMGQGANQAIESAWVLADCLTRQKDYTNAFDAYQKIRQNKASQIIKTSWQIGKLAHVKNPLLVTFRNAAMRMTPESVGRKQLEKIFELDY